MNRLSLNDWETMHVRKEIESIRKAITKKDIVDYAVVFDFTLLILGFFLDNAIIEEQGSRVVSWVFAGISLASLLGMLICYLIISLHRKKEDKLRKVIRSNRETISLIDDKICFYLMTAQTMYDNGIGTNSNVSRFYLIETSYYINKCSHIFMTISNTLNNVVVSGDKTEDYLSGRISKARIYNIIAILEDLYKQIDKVLSAPDIVTNDDLKRIKKENLYYCGELERVKNTISCK